MSSSLYHASRVALRYYIYEMSTCLKDNLEDTPLFHSYQEFRLCMMAYLLYGVCFIFVPWIRRQFIRHWDASLHEFDFEFDLVRRRPEDLFSHFTPPLYNISDTHSTKWTDHAPSSEACCICMDHPEKEDWVQLKCLHLFHKSCLTKWFSRSLTCPLCRKIVN